jgi:DNA-binding NtrC family response regulator
MMHSPTIGGGKEAPPADNATPVPVEIASTLRILVVDDERTLREACATVLAGAGFDVTASGNGDDALAMVQRGTFDVILLDLHMTPVSGMEILRAALEANKDTITVIMTGKPSAQASIEALRAGAWDCIPKPFSASYLEQLLGRAVRAVIATREARRVRLQHLEQAGNGENHTLLGSSLAFRNLVELALAAAPTDAPVMIMGESGTGKKLLAQFIHTHSRRAHRPLTTVNCAVVSERELFGAHSGALSGVGPDERGLLEDATGGTVFLDELTALSDALQTRLLRIVQDTVADPVGSGRRSGAPGVRFVSATSQILDEAVRAGTLRPELASRLGVVSLVLPPLRERPTDIPVLASHFLTQHWERHRPPSEPVPQLSEETLGYLRSRPWRGNIRELQHVIERVAVLAEPGREVAPRDIPLFEESGAAPAGGGIYAAIMDEAYPIADPMLLELSEREHHRPGRKGLG